VRSRQLDPRARAWIVGRAYAGYSYPKIARRLAASVLKIHVTPYVVRSLLEKEAPDLVALRNATWKRRRGTG